MVWDGSLFGYATPPVGGPVMPSPTPSPTPSPSPVPTPQPGQQTPQQLAQWVQQLLAGNAGGAEGNHGAFGGNAAGGSSGGGGGGLFGINGEGLGGYGGINLGPWGARALQALAAGVPGYGGLALSALQAAMRGANTYSADQNNRALGGGGLDFGQILGSVLGLNNYGSLQGNQTYVNRNGVPGRPGVAVTGGGIYDNNPLGGLDVFGLFSDPRTSDTFQESVDRHNITNAFAALMANDGPPVGSNRYLRAKQAANDAGYGYSAMPGGNFNGGQGAAGTVAGGQYGNVQTGGMAGPVNRNDSTGMLSRI
jgi:hypothetical protein